MKQKLYILALFTLAILGSCHRHRSSDPVINGDFSVDFDTLRATQIRVSVTPENDDIYYAVSLYYTETIEGMTEEELKAQEIGFLNNIYDTHKSYDEEYSYKDMLLFQGKRTFTRYNLSDDKDYEMLLFQVDPNQHIVMGNIKHVLFHTPPINRVALSFEVVSDHNSLHIYPSDKNVPYLWVYDTEEEIFDHYFTPYNFLYEITRMYEDYGFIELKKTYGDRHMSFPEDDPSIQPDKDYVLVLAGYNGEINSTITILNFHPDF